MNVVALRALKPEGRSPPARDERIARIEIFKDMAATEPYWRALEDANSLTTPYQRYDLLALWQRHVGLECGARPFIVIAFNATAVPLFLWPFCQRMIGRRRIIEFLGGKHANFNMGLWRRDVAGTISAAEIRAVIEQLAPYADALWLTGQPLTWDGTTNPFALLPHQRSANFGFSGSLTADFDALLRARTIAATRKKMRKKQRALAGYGNVRFELVAAGTKLRGVLDTFFKQKGARMRVLGIPDAFAAAEIRRFIEAAATEQLPNGAPLIEIYALSVDDIVVATLGGIVGGGRFSCMFNSIAQGHYANESPGEQLIVNLVRRCCERGFATFDLGIGEARYKNLFCSDAEPQFDSFLPLSRAGWPLTAAARIAAAIKRTVKQHPALWALMLAVRRLYARTFKIG